MSKLIVECSDYHGTGLYSGFCEALGEAVICVSCGGSGAETIEFKEFTGRSRKRGIKTISHSQGCFIGIGVGATGKAMTYKEFVEKIPAADVDAIRRNNRKVLS